MKTIAILSAALLAASPALAGGMAEPVTQPAPTARPVVPVAPAMPDWTGFYSGVRLGYAHVGTSGGVANGNGAIGGVQLGYLHDFGSWVAGGEVNYAISNADIDNGAGKFKNMARLEVKAGPKFGRMFVYGALGAAHAKADFGGASHSDTGYFGGIGLDYALNNQWSLGGEVLAHRFSDFDGTGATLKPVTAEMTLNYRF